MKNFLKKIAEYVLSHKALTVRIGAFLAGGITLVLGAIGINAEGLENATTELSMALVGFGVLILSYVVGHKETPPKEAPVKEDNKDNGNTPK